MIFKVVQRFSIPCHSAPNGRVIYSVEGRTGLKVNSSTDFNYNQEIG